jgi:hypothetical protein
MITLKKEVLQGIKIAEELGEFFDKIYDKYDDHEITNSELVEAIFSKKEEFKKVSFLTEESDDMLNFLGDTLRVFNEKELAEVHEYTSYFTWITEKLLDIEYLSTDDYKDYPTLCDYDKFGHNLKIENIVDFYTAIYHQDKSLLNNLDYKFLRDLSSMDKLKHIDFSKIDSVDEFDNLLMDLIVKIFDYFNLNRVDQFHSRGGVFNKSEVFYDLVNHFNDRPVIKKWIIEKINKECYESYDELEKLIKH